MIVGGARVANRNYKCADEVNKHQSKDQKTVTERL